MIKTDDPLENYLDYHGAGGRGADVFYTGDRTTALHAGLDSRMRGNAPHYYLIPGGFDPFGPYTRSQGEARGIHPTAAPMQAPGAQTPAPSGSQPGAGQPAQSDKAGLIVLAVIVALVLSR